MISTGECLTVDILQFKDYSYIITLSCLVENHLFHIRRWGQKNGQLFSRFKKREDEEEED